MKLKLLILVMIFCLPTIFAQTAKQILQIKTEVSNINKNAKTYKKTTKDVEDIAPQGTEARFFSSGKKLKKITAMIYGETFNDSTELYYKDNELIFAYEKMNRYDTQIFLKKPPKVVRIEEKRLYFADGKLVQLLVGKNNVKKGSKQWENAETDIADLEKKLHEAFKD